ncbi:GPR1/FUN34/yaaH family-domain-containing protein, partial [Blyttiomyces helicus]
IANPGPLGLSAFALTTFVLSFFNAGIIVNQSASAALVISLALGYGGLVQLLAGMWEFRCGNTFGATAFSSYGGFWISFGLILSPSSGIINAYTSTNDISDLENGLGIYLLSWGIFTFLMLVAAHRTNVAMVSLFASLFITFMLLAFGKFNSDLGLQKAGGIFG